MSSRLTRYGSSLRCVSKHFSTNHPLRPSIVIFQNSDIDPKKRAEGLESVFNNRDLFPLPGNVTTFNHYQISTIPKVNPESFVAVSDVLTASSREKLQVEALKEFGMNNAETGEGLSDTLSRIPSIRLECSAHQCPDLLKKDFADLFPNMNIDSMPLTVVTLTQKTENDMSAWSMEVESEREKLTSDFISIATQMCGSLNSTGSWADFIDPSSGRPYLGPFTNAVLAETDERYRHFGFKIEDMGCCKVISHVLWGTNTFVGTIFTNSPVDSPAVQELLETVNNSGVASLGASEEKPSLAE